MSMFVCYDLDVVHFLQNSYGKVVTEVTVQSAGEPRRGILS